MRASGSFTAQCQILYDSFIDFFSITRWVFVLDFKDSWLFMSPLKKWVSGACQKGGCGLAFLDLLLGARAPIKGCGLHSPQRGRHVPRSGAVRHPHIILLG